MKKRWWLVLGSVVAAIAYAAAPPQVQIVIRSLPRRVRDRVVKKKEAP